MELTRGVGSLGSIHPVQAGLAIGRGQAHDVVPVERQ
jgi:hypothetical protein